MQYMGGKSRISEEVSNIINRFTQDRDFVSLFCGACSVESKVVAKSKTCNDLHIYLIELLKGVQGGYIPPDTITKETYQYIKENKDENKALTGFVGFGCAFGGKWFGGYAKNNSGTNYAKQSKNSLLKKMKTLSSSDTVFTNKSYDEVEIQKGSIVYADPPYEGVTKYSNSNAFNHGGFWEYMRKLSKENLVFISEINAPEDFVAVWSKSLKRVLDSNKDNTFSSTEKLFIHRNNLKEFEESYEEL